MIGLGVYDALARDMVDPDTGEIYPALSCCNNSEMALRCATPGAEKVIWSIKGNSQFNSDCAVLLREAFRSGRLRLLITEYDAEKLFEETVKGFSSMSISDKEALKLPYIHTTLLIDELTKLQHEETGGKIRVFEKSGMRKDRYSSLSYNYYVALQIENKLNRRHNNNSGYESMFVVKPPKYKGRVVSDTGRGGYQGRGGWDS